MSHRQVFGAVVVALLVVLAGCAGGGTEDPLTDSSDPPSGDADVSSPTSSDGSTGPADGNTVGGDTFSVGTVYRPGPTDPAEMDRLDREDVIGWEAGYWHNDSIEVDLSDGLSEAEAGPYLARGMARVEYLRGEEFTREVTMTVVTEASFRERYSGTATEQQAALDRHWAQTYEAAFIPAGDNPAPGGSSSFVLLAFYWWNSDSIAYFHYEGDHPLAHPDGPHPYTLREDVLLHELMHAMEEEVGVPNAGARGGQASVVSDRQNAGAAVLEGQAEFIEVLYHEQCATGAWECVETPANPFPDNEDRTTQEHVAGGYQSHRYLDGVAFVEYLYTEGVDGRTGWNAVDYALQNPPRTAEQVTHPEKYPDEPFLYVGHVGGRNGWERGLQNTLGEPYLYLMFWAQATEYGIPIVDPGAFENPEGSLADRYVYESAPSEGWNSDTFVNYHKGEQDAWAWTIGFDTVRDAEEFRAAYVQVLEGHGGRQVGEYVWVVDDGEFAGAYVIHTDESPWRAGGQDRLIIAHAPTVEDLRDVHFTRSQLIDE